jgi:hypothetical protein
MSHSKAAMLVLSLALAANACASNPSVDCSYAARETARSPTPYDQELQARGHCAKLRGEGSLAVDSEHLKNLYFSEGLGEILVPTVGWYYVTPTGQTAPVLTYDNGADYFAEGLARTIRGGKVGFIDRSLSEIIPPTWDFAFPFAGGSAVVCNSCRSYPVGDEHSELRGGVWGYINRSGEVVVPIKYERDELPSPPPHE